MEDTIEVDSLRSILKEKEEMIKDLVADLDFQRDHVKALLDQVDFLQRQLSQRDYD